MAKNQKKNVRVSLSIPHSLKKQIESQAKIEKRSINKMMEIMARSYIREQDSPG